MKRSKKKGKKLNTVDQQELIPMMMDNLSSKVLEKLYGLTLYTWDLSEVLYKLKVMPNIVTCKWCADFRIKTGHH